MGIIQKIKDTFASAKPEGKKNMLTPKNKTEVKKKFSATVFDPKIKKVLQGGVITTVSDGHTFVVDTDKTVAELQKMYDGGKDNDDIEVLEHKAKT